MSILLSRLCLTIVLAATIAVPGLPANARAEPSYAKWGRIAMQETRSRYESASIVDYLHAGRRNLSPHLAEERFRLWLRRDGREFGVNVAVRFDPADDRLIAVLFE
ncbi:hypothetical protein J19TS2_59900 [Cohnella xylanilytica]|uniref:YqzG/YhdC family protein n=1 Tax=Cohnella xylanilytica TaxID=557555 RepID=A0A841U3D2_9BACL|nr:YqzG/YhdC family protein [Cohnella xylanilytica]MBB6695065.1 YqzG/YhdC family protein [Cohnella xylanilytica]GIO16435.1 hypothetical protein J19TS2_59900 [Cohnella xylanilytica]